MPKVKSTVIRKQWPTVVTTLNHGRLVYRVDARPLEGRKFITDKAEALAFADQLARLRNDGGALALTMPAALRQEATEAADILRPYNVGLVQAARHYAAFLKSEKAKAGAITVEKALDDYLDAKRAELARGELSSLTVTELETKLRMVRAVFGGRRVLDVDEASARSFLESLPHQARGRANIRTKFSQFLNHCRRRGWIVANPLDLVKVRVPAREVAALTVGEAEKVLRAAEQGSSPLLPWLVVGLFAGLRPFEALALRWEDIHLETAQIEARPETSKTRQRRFVPVEPLLAAWLLPRRQKAGKIGPPNFNKLWAALRKDAGLAKLSGKRSWKDILRHTHASYWLPIHGDRPRLAENLGNSVEVVRSHYRRAIPRAEADQFWQMDPAQPGNVVSVAALSKAG